MQPSPDITQLLEAWTGGNRAALDALMPLVMDELKRIAGAYLAREPHALTLQTTALVNEAYLRLVQVRPHERQREGVAVIRARLARFCMSAFDSSTSRLLRLM